MNILHICKSDIKGGAAKAANRVHENLLSHGINSKMRVGIKYGKDPNVISPQTTFNKAWELARPYIDSLPNRLYRKRNNNIFSNNFMYGIPIARKEIDCANIIHLHWLGKGTLSPNRIAKFKKPIIWRMPDMFPFTGGCHYSGSCLEYKDGCKRCIALGSTKNKDIAWLNWRRKYKAYKKIENFVVVAPSKWLADCAKNSRIMENARVEHIPTGVDLNIFCPMNKNIAKEILGITYPESKNIIAFGAINATSDQRKGFYYLKNAITEIVKERGYDESLLALVFGSEPNNNRENQLPIPTYYMGHLSDELSLKLVYNAADVFIQPSLEENLPNTGLEALACGTPVVGFNTGGMPDLIEHKTNGYLANYAVSKDLGYGILWCIRHKDFLSINSRKKAVKDFDINTQVNNYISLYYEIINFIT